MAPEPELLRSLESMPDELASAVERGRGRLRERTAEGGFSLLEHVWHLADLEAQGFGERIARLRAGGAPHLPDFDGGRLARERDYQSLDVAEGLRRFREARRHNVRLLRETAAAEWSQAGTQELVGPITLADLPRSMREHDDAHRREIAALVAGPASATRQGP